MAIAAVVALLCAPSVAGVAVADDPLPTLTMTQQPLYGGIQGAIDGQQITITSGVWSPTPSNLTWQWFRNGELIDGVTGNSYTPTDADVGSILSISETATLDGYQPYVFSATGYHVEEEYTADGPTIVGVPQVGVPLTGVVSDIEPTPTSVEYVWIAHGMNVENGPNATTYTPVAADIGSPITFSVMPRGGGPNYTSLGLQAVSAIVLPATFEQQGPWVLGSPTVGNVLTISQQWYPTPDQTNYQWMRDGVAIDGARGPTYTIVGDDAGHVLSVAVTVTHSLLPTVTAVATLRGGAVTRPFTTVPTPTLTGTAKLGSTLTAHVGASVPAHATYEYEFSEGPGSWSAPQSSATFTPINDGDVGFAVYVRAFATAPGYGPTVSAPSLPTAPIAPLSLHVKSVAMVGHVGLNDEIYTKVTLDSAAPSAEPPYTFVWMLNGTPIHGATGATYVPPMSDYGQKLTVAVTLNDPDWGTGSATSKASVVGEGNLTYANPRIAGTPKVGSTLYDDPYTAWGPGPVHIYYYWYEDVDDMSIKLLSRSATYTPTAALAGREVQLWESASEPHFYSIGSGWSGSQPVTIALGTLSQGSSPAIAGEPFVGTELVADHGSVSPSSGVKFAYQWFAATSPSADGVAIPHATSSTFAPTASLLGEVLSVRITASAAGYDPLVTNSGATSPVMFPPAVRERPAPPAATCVRYGYELAASCAQ
jgi:hypothetical protein